MQCPKCKLINPSSAQVCDCGYNFVTGQSDPAKFNSQYRLPIILKVVFFILPPAGFFYGLFKITSKKKAATEALIISSASFLLGLVLSYFSVFSQSR